MAGMDTIDEIREALGGTTPGPRNGGRPGSEKGGAGKRPETPDKRRPETSQTPLPAEFTVFSEACTNLSRGRVPGRGLLYSFLFHEIAMFLLLLHPGYRAVPTKQFRPVDQPLFIDAELLKDLLPPVGGGKKGGDEGKIKGDEGKKGDAAPGSQGEKGFMYPGPQPVVSKPPEPDNPIQTIRQPDLVEPPVLKVPLPVPNKVQLAAPEIPKAPDLKGTTHSLELPVNVPEAPPPPPEVKPKLTLPKPKPEVATLPTQARKDLAQAAPKLDVPKPPKVLPSSGTALRNLAVLSPIVPHKTEIAEIPLGEAHGHFAIGPEAVKSKLAEAGAGTGNAPGAGAATTAVSAGGTGSGAAANGHGTDAGSGVEAGNGTGTGSASGTGQGRAGLGPGAGGQGGGLGAGSGTGKGTGVGAGLGPGRGPFPGLSIDGGVGTAGSIPRTTGYKLMFGPDKPYNYGLTVEAEGKSGGGLRDFGVFHDEQVYTVYLDVSQPGDPAYWTLQYAVLRPAASTTVVSLKKAVPASAEQQVLAPFPSSKEDPKLPPEVTKQYPGHMIVVYAEITAEGKLRKLHIMDSPDIELSQLVLQALFKWDFKPAILDGKPVAVRALFGVPLAPPEKPVDHAPVAPVAHHVPAPPPLRHAPAPPPLAHVPAPPPLPHHSQNEVRALTLNPDAPARTVTLNPNASGRAVTLKPDSPARTLTLKPAAPGARKPAPPPTAAPKRAPQKPEERELTLK
jgi:hypothetical protein